MGAKLTNRLNISLLCKWVCDRNPSSQTERELIDLVGAWGKAGVNQRHEVCTALFPDGLVWSHEWGLLDYQNRDLTQGLRTSTEQVASGDMFGVPDGI